MMDTCPHCDADLQGDPIPEESRHCYGNATHFRREIGIEIRGVYDGVLFWRCPDCSLAWPRRGPLEELSQKYVEQHNAARL